jgi:hypothetical protein
VRIRSTFGGRQEELHAPGPARRCLDGLDERAADATPAISLVDDESAELSGRSVVLDCGGDVKVRKSCGFAPDTRDEHAIAAFTHMLEPTRERRRVDWVTELRQQACERRRVFGSRIADEHAHRV